jgi:malate permease and related proteins
MAAFFNVVTTIIAPILSIAGTGVVADRLFQLDVRTIARLNFYFCAPALIFAGMAQSSLRSGEIGQIALLAIVFQVVITMLGWWVSRLMHLSQRTTSAFLLSVALLNAGNYGLPLNEFAFGQVGLERAIIFFTASAVFTNTVGVFVASRGNASLGQSVLNVFKNPLPYATGLGLVVNQQWLPVAEPLLRAVEVLGRAAVPLLLLLLGIQLSRTSLRGSLAVIFLATAMRLLGSVLLVIPLAALIGLSGVSRQVAILQASMPTAVSSIVLAVEFDSDAEIVSSVVLASTLASIITLSGLLLYLS